MLTRIGALRPDKELIACGPLGWSHWLAVLQLFLGPSGTGILVVWVGSLAEAIRNQIESQFTGGMVRRGHLPLTG